MINILKKLYNLDEKNTSRKTEITKTYSRRNRKSEQVYKKIINGTGN